MTDVYRNLDGALAWIGFTCLTLALGLYLVDEDRPRLAFGLVACAGLAASFATLFYTA